jgi:putative PEP-CTERM system histidine kinase
MPASINSLATISYGLGFLAFVTFSCQLALRPAGNRRTRVLLIASALTALWELGGLTTAVWPSEVTTISYLLLDSARYAAWILVIGTLLPSTDPDRENLAPWHIKRSWPAIGAGAILMGAMLFGNATIDSTTSGSSAWMFSVWVAACVYGVVLCEQLFRTTPSGSRWAIKPLCLALGASLAFDLFMFADAMMLRTVDSDLWSIRGLVHALTIPMIMIATARNRDWTIDVAVSRVVVFRSTALLLSGIYLLAVAGTGYYVRFFGGGWGKAIQTVFFFIAAVLLLALFSSGTIRAQLRVFISKHFFSYRYDYREEWLRFTNLLANPAAELSVMERTIKALADLVESPGGALWLKAEDGSLSLAGRWNAPEIPQADFHGSTLPDFLTRTGWVVELAEHRLIPERYAGLVLPSWLNDMTAAWLIIPLPATDALLGFVLLVRPRVPLDVNWEVLDLLKTAARQAASFVGHLRATEALVQAKQFDAFNRMAAFVVHDLKNLIAQLSLMLRNAERHAANPEFQKDMHLTIQHVVERMNRLLVQLHSGTTPVENPKYVDLSQIVRRVGASLLANAASITLEVAPGLRALGHEDRLERVIGHLVQNAIDATQHSGTVCVRVFAELDRAVVEVLDTGQGMTPEFVRDRLFKPFDSTKPTGMGIGAYESQQYVSDLGGLIAVESAPGAGTRIRVFLPASMPQDNGVPARQEAA